MSEMPGDERNNDDAKGPDVVVLTGPTDDGRGVRVLRARANRLEAGEVRPLKEGQPLVAGEIVKLVPRAESRVCDVEVLATIGSAQTIETTSDAKGDTLERPAQVATRSYRDSWDRIFGATRKPSELPN